MANGLDLLRLDEVYPRFWTPAILSKSSGLVLGRRPLGVILHSSNEPGELSQWLCHDDSTISIALVRLLLLLLFFLIFFLGFIIIIIIINFFNFIIIIIIIALHM